MRPRGDPTGGKFFRTGCWRGTQAVDTMQGKRVSHAKTRSSPRKPFLVGELRGAERPKGSPPGEADPVPRTGLRKRTAMLIITADDYGKAPNVTEGILKCFSEKRITSASAMVFMDDSKRAASLAISAGMEVGLHLNFTSPFDGSGFGEGLRRHQTKVMNYLVRNKLSQVFYNPFLTNSFAYLTQAQREEFQRLYGREPAFYNGHHHMHLCANVLGTNLIPRGVRVRRTFTFGPGEKGTINRSYRRVLDRIVGMRFITSDCFFSVEPVHDHGRLERIFNRAGRDIVEIEVHPENGDEKGFLLSSDFGQLLRRVCLGTFGLLHRRS